LLVKDKTENMQSQTRTKCVVITLQHRPTYNQGHQTPKMMQHLESDHLTASTEASASSVQRNIQDSTDTHSKHKKP
jgi:hypothetical protein